MIGFSEERFLKVLNGAVSQIDRIIKIADLVSEDMKIFI